jgi:hypothetical protein
VSHSAAEFQEQPRPSAEPTAFLFLGRTPQAPPAETEFVLFQAGLPEVAGEGEDAELPVEPEELDYVSTFLSIADSRPAAERAVEQAWCDTQGGELSLQLLAVGRREMTRRIRHLVTDLEPAGVAQVGMWIGFKRDAAEAYDAALHVIRLAVLRKWWHFWR